MQTEQKLLSNRIICTETECEVKKRMTITSFQKPSFYQRQCIFVTTQERRDELEMCTFVMHLMRMPFACLSARLSRKQRG